MIPQLAPWHWSPVGIAADLVGVALIVVLFWCLTGIRDCVAKARNDRLDQISESYATDTHDGVR